jgi:endo-1,4-beta-D-glucanase Y
MTKTSLFILALLFTVLGAGRIALADEPAAAGWTAYRDRFVAGDGRVLDTANQAISHTEGQGWAMILAEGFDDRATFDRIWSWTHDKLQRRDSALFSWKWDGKAQVADPNDAADGDILIAWALGRAARHWREPKYEAASRRILGDIRRKLIAPAAGRLVLLPGAAGFRNAHGPLVVNPSYYIYPAFAEFGRLTPSVEWQRLRRDGLGLLAEARFGRWGLTPDWVDIEGDGRIVPDAHYPPRFGFDAVRIPLYLIWAGEATPERLASYLDFWNVFGNKPVPAWADVTDNSVAPYEGSAGVRAIIDLTRTYRDRTPPAPSTIRDGDDYYAASLTLLAALARREMPR